MSKGAVLLDLKVRFFLRHFGENLSIYPTTSKVRNLIRRLPRFFDRTSEHCHRQGTIEKEKSGVKPTKSKTNFCNSLNGIIGMLEVDLIRKIGLFVCLVAGISIGAREFDVLETMVCIENMISQKKVGAYLCFLEEDMLLANGLKGDLWAQIEIQDVFALKLDNVLKSYYLPFTALKGHRQGERWSANLFNKEKDSWIDCYASLSNVFLSSTHRKECIRFFEFLRSHNPLIVADAEIGSSTRTLLFGPNSRFVSSEEVEELEFQNYTVVILAAGSSGKALSKRLLDRREPLFIIDLSGLSDALMWSKETWEQWICKKQKIKILYTSALISRKFEERKNEYIRCLELLDSYGYKDRIYVVESGPYTPLSFFDVYCDHLLYANTNDTSLINKGINEAKASLAAFDYFAFDDDDMIVKITGRYLFNDDHFLRLVEAHPEVDAYGSFHPVLGVVTGCFAMRYKYYKRMLKSLDFEEMERNLVNIEKELEKFLKIMESENAKVVYLDKIGITANIANVVIEQW